jgi:elongation factor 1 alpha-like protein
MPRKINYGVDYEEDYDDYEYYDYDEDYEVEDNGK